MMKSNNDKINKYEISKAENIQKQFHFIRLLVFNMSGILLSCID
jgi:hypothetical protein